MLNNFKQYLEEEPNYRSYKEAGHQNVYSTIQKGSEFGPTSRFSKSMRALDEEVRLETASSGPACDLRVKDTIRQCVGHHQVFLSPAHAGQVVKQAE